MDSAEELNCVLYFMSLAANTIASVRDYLLRYLYRSRWDVLLLIAEATIAG